MLSMRQATFTKLSSLLLLLLIFGASAPRDAMAACPAGVTCTTLNSLSAAAAAGDTDTFPTSQGASATSLAQTLTALWTWAQAHVATYLEGLSTGTISTCIGNTAGGALVQGTCPGGGGGISALTGDVTASGSGSVAATIANSAVTTAKINNSAVTLAKIANAAANSKLLGAGASGSGSAYGEITLGSNLSMSGTTLNAASGSGTGCVSSGTSILYGDGAGGCSNVTASTGVGFSGGVLTATIQGAAAGLTTVPGTENTTACDANHPCPQLFPVSVASSCTVNSNCNSSVTNEAGEYLVVTGAAVTITFPNPASGTKGTNYHIGSDGTHAATITTAGGVAKFYGDLGATGSGATSYALAVGVDYIITDNAATGPAGASGNYKVTALSGFNGKTFANEGAGVAVYDSTNSTTGSAKLKTLVQGSNITLTDNGASGITIASSGGGGGTVPQIYITGLLVTKHTAANTLDISAGEFYDPGSAGLVTCTAQSALSAGSLGASQWNQVYATDSSGCTFEVVNNADPPSTTYAGNMARKGGTGGNRRWIGGFLTDGSSNIIDRSVSEGAANEVTVSYLANTTAAPFRVLTAGVATTFTSVSLSGVVPKYAAGKAMLRVFVGMSAGSPFDAATSLSVDGTNESYGIDGYVATSGSFPRTAGIFPIVASATPQVWYEEVGGGGGTVTGYLDVFGYQIAR